MAQTRDLAPEGLRDELSEQALFWVFGVGNSFFELAYLSRCVLERADELLSEHQYLLVQGLLELRALALGLFVPDFGQLVFYSSYLARDLLGRVDPVRVSLVKYLVGRALRGLHAHANLPKALREVHWSGGPTLEMERAPILSEMQLKEIKEAFDTFDIEKKGKITLDKFKIAVKSLGFTLTADEEQAAC